MKGTLFCSECGSDLETPAVPTFNLNDEEISPLPSSPPLSWKNPEVLPGGGYTPTPRPTYNPASNPSAYGFPPDEDYEPIMPVPPVYNPTPLPRVPGYNPAQPSYNPSPPTYNSNPGGYVMPPKPPKPPPPSSRNPIRDDLRLIVLNSGRVIECPDKDNVIIGRSDTVTGERPDIDLTLDNAVELGVSRRHVCITFRDDTPFLTDLGSKNYTFLNRRQMMRGQPYPLQNGDEVRLGNVILKVLYDPDGLL